MSNSEAWAIKTAKSDAPLLRLYFHGANFEYLQVQSSEIVKQKTGITIATQKTENSLLMMMGIYNLHGEDSIRHGLEGGLVRLNKLFIDQNVGGILSGLAAYKDYHKHASQLPVPMEHAKQTNVKGLNSLEERGYMI